MTSTQLARPVATALLVAALAAALPGPLQAAPAQAQTGALDFRSTIVSLTPEQLGILSHRAPGRAATVGSMTCNS